MPETERKKFFRLTKKSGLSETGLKILFKQFRRSFHHVRDVGNSVFLRRSKARSVLVHVFRSIEHRCREIYSVRISHSASVTKAKSFVILQRHNRLGYSLAVSSRSDVHGGAVVQQASPCGFLKL